MADGICEHHHQENEGNKSPIGLVRKATNLGSNAINNGIAFIKGNLHGVVPDGRSATDSRVNHMVADKANGDADGDGEVSLVRIVHLLRAVITRDSDGGAGKERKQREERVKERNRDIHFCMLNPDGWSIGRIR